MPYHVWLLDEMAKELRGRLHLAVAESLHVTHVLLRGLLAGATGSKTKDRWERHLLRAVGEDGQAGMGETRSIYIVHSLAKRAFSSECLRRKSSTSGQTDTKPNKLSDCFFPHPHAGTCCLRFMPSSSSFELSSKMGPARPQHKTIMARGVHMCTCWFLGAKQPCAALLFQRP